MYASLRLQATALWAGLWKQGPYRETPSFSGAVATNVHVFNYLLPILSMLHQLSISFTILFSLGGGNMDF